MFYHLISKLFVSPLSSFSRFGNYKLIIDLRLLGGGDGGIVAFSRGFFQGILQKFNLGEVLLVGDQTDFAMLSDLLDTRHDRLTLIDGTSRPVFRYLFKPVLSFLLSSIIRGNCAIWHPFNTGVLFLSKRFKTYVTVHDTLVIDMPNHVRTFARAIRAYELRNSFRRANCIVAISRFTATRVGCYLAANNLSRRIVVIYNRLDFPALRDGYNTMFDGRYCLFVGVNRRAKNINFLLRAFAKFVDNTDYKGSLLICGSFQENSVINYLSLAKDLQLAQRVQFMGFVSDSDLISLYKNADLFLFPSYYEGFGYPVLEAQAVGTKVVASFACSLGELDLGSITYASPYCIEDFAKKMEASLADTSTVFLNTNAVFFSMASIDQYIKLFSEDL